MNEYTQTTDEIVAAYVESRRSTSQVPERQGREEFDRFLDAHDQGIRDAVKPPELTAKEHLEAAFEAAYPIPEGRDVPEGVPVIVRWEDGEIRVHAMGSTAKNRVTNDYIEVRTLEPLPTLIPDDCNAVWASTREDESRRVWVRFTGFTPGLDDAWDDGNLDADYAETSDLIDPKPVPKEES